MYLLDTDVIIWLLRGRADVVEQVKNLSASHSIAISVISVAEIYQNIFPTELNQTEDFLEAHILLSVDVKTAKQAGYYSQLYAKKLKNLTLTDCLIAATAHTQGATLLSFNTKHFPMTDIAVYNPLKIE